MFSRFTIFLVLLGLINSSYQQNWRNDKIVWDPNFFNQGQAQRPAQQVFQQQNFQQPQQQQWNQFVQKAPQVQAPVPAPVPVPAPAPQQPRPVFSEAPAPAPVPVPAPAPVPVPVAPVQAAPAGNGPYPIRQPTITNTGETIIENLIGGILFDCQGKPTGHHRDNKYCDVFHACVYGQQRKTYSCPFVGEHTYFDDVTRRCEFVRNSPNACASNAYLSF